MFLGEVMDGTEEQPTLREKAYESFTRHLLARDVRP
ncbi:GntR family transcriptional regulator, partial [Rhizobium ruizarguesonis]